MCKDHVFALNAEEATTPEYGYESTGKLSFTRAKSMNGKYHNWWLRSALWNPTTDLYKNVSVGVVSSQTFIKGQAPGFLTHYLVDSRTVGVSPALMVDLESTVFSVLTSGKAGATGATYKLAVTDPKLVINKTANADVTKTENTVTVPYTISGDNAANATRASVIILDKEYTPGNTNGAVIKYYQRLDGTFSNNGAATGTFTLPSNYNSSWKTYIIAEDVNNEKETDFVSIPVGITFPGSGSGGETEPSPSPMVSPSTAPTASSAPNASSVPKPSGTPQATTKPGGSDTTTTTNPDGSTTTTTTNPDGSTTTTTTNSDGSSTATTTNPDGSSTTTTTNSDGSSTATTTNSDGSTTTTTTSTDDQGNRTTQTETTNTDGSTQTVTETVNTDGTTETVTEIVNSDGTIRIITMMDKKGNVVSQTVAIVKATADSKGSKVTIPKTVKVNGKTYSVTGLRKGMFSENKPKPKTIVIYACGIIKVERGAFDNISKHATIIIKAGKKDFKRIKKLIEASGIPKGVKIKRKK